MVCGVVVGGAVIVMLNAPVTVTNVSYGASDGHLSSMSLFRLSPNMRDDWLAQRWPALASACAQESVAGVTYAFALYSNALRERLGLSQQRLDLVATAENTSGILVPVIGLVMYLCGPRPTLRGRQRRGRGRRRAGRSGRR